MRLNVVTVVYGKRFEESVTLRTLFQSPIPPHCHVRLFIWHNGPPSMLAAHQPWPAQLSARLDIDVMESTTNVPLAKIYNENIRRQRGTEYDFLIILDDDTNLPANFFSRLVHDLPSAAGFVHVPIVIQAGKIVSPARRNTSQFEFIGPGFLSGRDTTAIGSAMIIPRRYAEENDFDERLTFYGIDHDYLQSYLKTMPLRVLDLILHHSISTRAVGAFGIGSFKLNSLLFAVIYNGRKHGYPISSFFRSIRVLFAFRRGFTPRVLIGAWFRAIRDGYGS